MLLLTTAIAGLGAGAAYALIGLSTLVTYRFVGVVNFTQTAVGALGALIMADLWDHGFPLVGAVLAGLAVAAALHALIGMGLIAWFGDGNVGIKTAVTVALFGAIVAAGEHFFSSQFPRTFPTPFDGRAFTVAGVAITWLVVVSCGLAIALAVGAGVFLERTHTGLRLRALSERPTTAQLVGIPAQRIAVVVWATTGAITALGLMLVAPEFPSDFATLALLITAAFGAALVGNFHSFGRTLFGGLAIGVLQGASSSLGGIREYRGVLPTVVILLVLLYSQRRATWEQA